MTNEICDDNRFEIIEAAKQELIRCTNIEMCPDEMSVIDSVLFRLWQMGWLPGQERTCEWVDHGCTRCDYSDYSLFEIPERCPGCGAKVIDWC